MRRLFRPLVLFFFLFIPIIALPARAIEPNPTGMWELTTGESRFEVLWCGDGTELCAVLIWIRDDLRTKDNLAKLDTYVVRGARLDEANHHWSGEVIFGGNTYLGTMTLLSKDSMSVRSCMGMLCKSYEFRRR